MPTTCIFWANLTPFSLKAEGAEAGALDEEGGDGLPLLEFHIKLAARFRAVLIDREQVRAPHHCQREGRRRVGPEVGPASAFDSCAPTAMRGPTCIVWASIAPCSLTTSSRL
jgi:hypothetical protein